MGDIELTFDEMFASSRKSSQQDLPGLSIRCKLPLSESTSPMYPKAPHPTTTVTPVLTPAVIKAPWNYKTTLEEAFPDAEFIYTECDSESMTLEDWVRLRDFESPSEDYRLAVLVRDRLPCQDKQKDEEQYLMSGALPNDEDEKPVGAKAEVKPDIVNDWSNNEGTENGKKQDKHTEKQKENVSFLSDQEDSYEDSSDDFDELPHGTGMRNGWL